MPTFLGRTGPDERRHWLAEKLAGIPGGVTIDALAEECGVSHDTIARDLETDAFHTYVKTRIQRMARGFGCSKAFRNILTAISDGDISTSKWLIERCGIFEADANKNEWEAIIGKLFGPDINLTQINITPAAGDNGNGHHPLEEITDV